MALDYRDVLLTVKINIFMLWIVDQNSNPKCLSNQTELLGVDKEKYLVEGLC